MATPEQSSEPEHRYFDMDTANAVPVTSDDSEVVESDPDAELRGIRRLKLASLLGVVGVAVFILVPIAILLVPGVGLDFASVGPGTADSLFTDFVAVIVGLTVGPLILVASFATYLAGFAKLRTAEPKFTVPLALGIVGVIGLLMLAGAFGLLLYLVDQICSCGGPGVATTLCVNPPSSSLYLDLALGGILPALIGWIGLLLGLYRTGSRYSSTQTRLGALLYPVPLLTVVAPLVVWLGTRDIERVLEEPVAPSGSPYESGA
jgi:hypothetical protein